jgi:hypothetical protein
LLEKKKLNGANFMD